MSITIKRWLIWVVSSLFLTAIVWAVCIFLWGVTTIKAKADGEPVVAHVFINGEYKGDTPLKLRLGPGVFEVEIKPPKGYRGKHESWWLWTVGLGTSITEQMAPLGYQVNLYAPHGVPAAFEIIDRESGHSIATCDGEECEIPLPGPGRYDADMAICDQGDACSRGTSSFHITDEQPEANVSWR